jgi:hypothetical protein
VIVSACQRWHSRRDAYRPAGELINPARYEVEAIPDDATARAFVCAHHYSGSYPAARFRAGLYRAGELVGVAVFSVPTNDAALSPWLPGSPRDHVELGRFVLLDDVPANGETWFLARAFEFLRGKVGGILSFSDPMSRVDAAGDVVFPGHIGTIYQAHNARYLGLTQRRTWHLLPDGHVLSARAIQKVRGLERGWRYVVEGLQRFGAGPFVGEPRDWLATWLPRITRTIRHPGNHRYVWGLDRAVRRHVERLPELPYPKVSVERAMGAA